MLFTHTATHLSEGNTMTKIKWRTLLLAGVLSLNLLAVGCGGGDAVSSDPQPEDSQPETTTGQGTGVSTTTATTAGNSTPTPSETDKTVAKTTVKTATTTKAPSTSTGAGGLKLDKEDFTYLWWPDGVKSSAKVCNVASGNYGFQFDAQTAKIKKMGAFSSGKTETEVRNNADNAFMESLPDIVDMQYTMISGGGAYKVAGVTSKNDPTNALRVIESGTYMQHSDVWQLKFSGTDTPARASFSAVSDYFTYSFYVDGAVVGTEEITLSVSLRFGSKYTDYKNYTDTSGRKACSVATASGEGFIFVSPKDSNDTFKFDKNTKTLTISVTKMLRQKNDQLKLTWDGLDFICAPVKKVTEQAVQYHFNLQQVAVSGVHMEPDMKIAPVAYNGETGVYEIALPDNSKYSDMTIEANHDRYAKMQITLENPTKTDLTVPINLYKRWSNGVTYNNIVGVSVIIRDAKTKEPTGIDVQLSKNWHGADKTSLYKGPWFSGIAYIVVPAGQKVQYEVVTAYAKWGTVYAANHSQLSLAGYNSGSKSMLLWQTSGLGCFDQEAFCYDVDVALGNAIINDVRILCVGGNGSKGTKPELEGAKYVRTNEVGGGDFFVWYDKSGNKQRLVNMKVSYDSYGPNLTSVSYTGQTAGGEVAATITTNLPRTTDLNKCYMTFKYEFKKDVAYNRLAFFTCGADGFNDHIWLKIAYGNAAGLTKEIPLSSTDRYVGYLKNEQQAIEVPGGSAWVTWYQPQRSTAAHKHDSLGPLGNRGFAVRSYTANINGKTYTNPSLSFYHTNHNKQAGVAAELVAPAQANGVIKAGSVVTCTVEYLVFPQKKTDYYGSSATLKSLPSSYFDSWQIGHEYASKGQVSVSVSKGTLTSSAPVSVKAAAQSGVVADFTVKGGMGFVPMTVTGLNSYSGYRLYKVEGGKETLIDQSLSGQTNDYWQCTYDAITKTYALTFNVEHNGNTAQYRLKKVS